MLTDNFKKNNKVKNAVLLMAAFFLGVHWLNILLLILRKIL